jgi:hypothetical protein
MIKNLDVNRGFIRLFIAMSLIWFSYNIYQSYKYLGDKWSYNEIKVSHNERETEFRNNVCGSWNKKVIEKLQDPIYWTKNHKWSDQDKGISQQQWFQENTDKVQFYNKTNGLYESTWKGKYCLFAFKKPKNLKSRITYGTKKYFYYSLFPIPIYLLMIFVINGFKRKVK